MPIAPRPTPRSGKPVPTAPVAVKEPAADKASPPELGLTERRRLVRPLPTPQVSESQGDSDWAIFQTLLSDNQKI